jgi:hypothetical protein
MTTWVFAGPSLWQARPTLPPDVALHPPVAAGDVYTAVLSGAERIAIVDGLFGDRPAVRHKELLWALAQGVPVLGAASMGALRAAELAPWGIEGVGVVFEGYRCGRYTRDGDVAVAHAPPELGWQPLTLAIVDLEAILRRGLVAMGHTTHRLEGWLAVARAIPFVHRTRKRVVDSLRRAGDGAPLEPLLRWLDEDAFSQKRADAEALLARLARPSPAPVLADFPADMFHERALAEARRRLAAGRAAGSGRKAAVGEPFAKQRLVVDVGEREVREQPRDQARLGERLRADP